MLGDRAQGVRQASHRQSREDAPSVVSEQRELECRLPAADLSSNNYVWKGLEPDRLRFPAQSLPVATRASFCCFLRPDFSVLEFDFISQRSPCPHPALGMDIPRIPRPSLELASPGFLLASAPLS